MRRFAPMVPAPLLELRGVTRAWGPHEVLSGIDLELGAGHVVGVKGPNGAGKTTLLRIVAGVLRPTAGDVLLGGLHPEYDGREYRRRVGLLSAGDRGLYPRLSVRRHLQLAAAIALMEPDAGRQAVERGLEAFALAPFADLPAQRLSLGQRQRARLALTFLHRPDAVVLDEPTNSLDEEGRELLVAELERLRARGGAAVCCDPSGHEDTLGTDAGFELREGRLHAA